MKGRKLQGWRQTWLRRWLELLMIWTLSLMKKVTRVSFVSFLSLVNLCELN